MDLQAIKALQAKLPALPAMPELPTGERATTLAVAAGASVTVLAITRWWTRSSRRTPLGTDRRPGADVSKRRMIARRLPASGEVDVVVIGSGIGGMTAGSLLSQHGLQVLVLESHDKAGGCTHSFELTNDGTTMEFDTGTHYTAVDMSQKFARCGALMNLVTGGLEWSDLGDPYDRVVLPHDPVVPAGCPNRDSYDFVRGQEAQVQHILEAINPNHPHLAERVRSFLAFCWKARKTVNPLFVQRAMPRWLSWLMPNKSFFDYGRLTTAYVMTAIFDHGFSHEEVLAGKPLPEPLDPESDDAKTWRRVKGVMIHPLGDYACQPRDSSITAHALTAIYYQSGAAYTVGATQNISRGAANRIIDAGGDVLVNAKVQSIIIENGRAVGVRVAKATSGESETMGEIRAKYVVNATGMYNLYNRLLPADNPTAKAYKATCKTEPSTGHNYLFVAIEGSPKEAGIPTTNTWYFNSYDTDQAFDEYFANPSDVRPPTVYLGFPCTKDKTWNQRYPGKSNCIMISDAKWSWYEQWENSKARHRGETYDQFKEKLTQQLLSILYDKIPQVKGKVLWTELGTPLSDAHFLSSYHGGSYGTRCNTEYFSRESGRWIMRGDTEIPGLYMAGQDGWMPSVAGAMYGGLLCTTKILGPFSSLRLFAKFLSNMARDDPEKRGLWNAFARCFNLYDK